MKSSFCSMKRKPRRFNEAPYPRKHPEPARRHPRQDRERQVLRGRVAARVGELREQLGLSGRDFAKKLKLPASTYYTYESGAADIPLDILPKLAKALGVTIIDLMPQK